MPSYPIPYTNQRNGGKSNRSVPIGSGSERSRPKASNETAQDQKDWRRPGQALREELVLKDQEEHGFVLDHACDIENYYQVADKVYERFVNHIIDTKEDMIEAYVIGMRLVRFLSITLPSHRSFNDRSLGYAKSKTYLQTAGQYLSQIARLIDEMEHSSYVSRVLNNSEGSSVTSGPRVTADNSEIEINQRLETYVEGATHISIEDPKDELIWTSSDPKRDVHLSISHGSMGMNSILEEDPGPTTLQPKPKHSHPWSHEKLPEKKKEEVLSTSWQVPDDIPGWEIPAITPTFANESSMIFNSSAEWNQHEQSQSPSDFPGFVALKTKKKKVDQIQPETPGKRRVKERRRPSRGLSTYLPIKEDQQGKDDDLYSPPVFPEYRERSLKPVRMMQSSPSNVADFDDWLSWDKGAEKEGLPSPDSEHLLSQRFKNDQVVPRGRRLQPFRDCVRSLLME